MNISDSFVWLQAQNSHQTTETDWQTVSDSGPPGIVNLLENGPSFLDFLTGQLEIPEEEQGATSSVGSANFASGESMRLIRELADHKENFSLLAELPSLEHANSFSFRRQPTSLSFMSNYRFPARLGNGLFFATDTWSGRYGVNLQQPWQAQFPGLLFNAADASAGGSRTGARTSFFQPIVRHEWHLRQEKQELQFAARGSVTTEDGQHIAFNMDRTYNQSVSVLSADTSYLASRPLIDPLVLDLDGQGVGFSNETIDFDLTGDGALENFSCLDDGCGFLAYDNNGDGRVTNGLELFGIASGSGFAELAAYDEDGNNWIDENDAIYNDLSIWTPTASGTSLLQSLQDADVGAICLADVDSSFDIVGDDGELQGQISGSGVYLTESGQVETVHQIDIAVLDQHQDLQTKQS